MKNFKSKFNAPCLFNKEGCVKTGITRVYAPLVDTQELGPHQVSNLLILQNVICWSKGWNKNHLYNMN